MGLETSNDNNKTFLSVVQGKLRRKVTEETAGAVKREYETSDGEKGVKWELVYGAVSGTLVSLGYVDGTYGEVLEITLQDGDDKYTVTLGADSDFGKDFAKKLPNIDLEMYVTIKPYDFTDKQGKRRRGLTVLQEGKKLYSFYYDIDAKKNVNGIPLPKGDTKKYTSAKWKAHFLNEFIFLQEQVNEFIEKTDFPEVVATESDQEVEEDELSDVPF